MRLVTLVVHTVAVISLGVAGPGAGENLPGRHYSWETSCRHPLPNNAGFEPHELESWADYLCLGRPLDMRVFDRDSKAGCDPHSTAGWPATRRLSDTFLRTVPIRLSPIPTTSRVLQIPRVKLGLGRAAISPAMSSAS